MSTYIALMSGSLTEVLNSNDNQAACIVTAITVTWAILTGCIATLILL